MLANIQRIAIVFHLMARKESGRVIQCRRGNRSINKENLIDIIGRPKTKEQRLAEMGGGKTPDMDTATVDGLLYRIVAVVVEEGERYID
jgi:hypothetical protein